MKAIKNKTEYQKALNMLNNVFNAKLGTTASNKADQLAILIENYELTEQLTKVLQDCMMRAGRLFCANIDFPAEAEVGTCWIH